MIGFFGQSPTAITFDAITAFEESVSITHDYVTHTANVPVYIDGKQTTDLHYNPIDGIHYSKIIGLAAGATYQITTTDENGAPVYYDVTTATEKVRPTPTRTRWVDPAGSGSTYSETEPGDLDAALNSENANDRIICKAGTYRLYRTITPNNVILEAAPGATVIISGFRSTQPTWTVETAPRYSTTNYDANCRFLCFLESGLKQQLPWQADVATLDSVPHGWTIEAGKLQIKLPGGLDPSAETIYLSDTHQHGIVVDGDGCWIENLIFEGFGAGATANSRCLPTSGDNIMVKNCTFRDNKNDSIRLVSSTGVTIEGCTFSMNRKYMRIFSEVKLGNNYDSESAVAIVISGGSKHTIRDCTFSGQMDSIINLDVAGGDDIDIYDCTFSNCFDELISNDGTHKHVSRWNNVIAGSFHWIGYATVINGPAWIFNERAYDIGNLAPIEASEAPEQRSLAQGLDVAKFNFSNATVGMTVCYNNTVDARFGDPINNFTSARFQFANLHPQGNFISKNNIIVCWGSVVYDWNATGTLTLDHNHYYTPDSFAYGSQLWRFTGSKFAGTLAEFQAVSGQDANSTFGDPLLTNGIPAAPITGGLFLPGITDNAALNLTIGYKGASLT